LTLVFNVGFLGGWLTLVVAVPVGCAQASFAVVECFLVWFNEYERNMSGKGRGKGTSKPKPKGRPKKYTPTPLTPDMFGESDMLTEGPNIELPHAAPKTQTLTIYPPTLLPAQQPTEALLQPPAIPTAGYAGVAAFSDAARDAGVADYVDAAAAQQIEEDLPTLEEIGARKRKHKIYPDYTTIDELELENSENSEDEIVFEQPRPRRKKPPHDEQGLTSLVQPIPSNAFATYNATRNIAAQPEVAQSLIEEFIIQPPQQIEEEEEQLKRPRGRPKKHALDAQAVLPPTKKKRMEDLEERRRNERDQFKNKFNNIKHLRRPYVQSIPDYRLKPLNKMTRPTFSPHLDSYEIDYLIVGDDNTPPFIRYLVCINVNTRYLVIKPGPWNSRINVNITLNLMMEIDSELMEEFGLDRNIKSIRGDADKSFATPVRYTRQIPSTRSQPVLDLGGGRYIGNSFTKYLADAKQEYDANQDQEINKYPRMSLYLSDGVFNNYSVLCNRVIRTIRDKLKIERHLLNPALVQLVVREYNHTPHAAFNYEFTPYQVQNDLALEAYFIRENMYNLQKIKQMQADAGLFGYRKGNILMVYLRPIESSRLKTVLKLHENDKRRRTFRHLAYFVDYQYGNALCYLYYYDVSTDTYKFVEKNYIELGLHAQAPEYFLIPLQYTKKIADTYESLPEYYKNYFKFLLM
jgi:hypothetical protein